MSTRAHAEVAGLGTWQRCHGQHGVFRRDRAVIVAEEVEQLAEETAQRFAWTVGYEDKHAPTPALSWMSEISVYISIHTACSTTRASHARLSVPWRCSLAVPPGAVFALGLSPMAHARLIALVSTAVHAHGGAAGPLDDSLDVLLSQGRESLLRASQDTVAAEVVDVDSVTNRDTVAPRTDRDSFIA